MASNSSSDRRLEGACASQRALVGARQAHSRAVALRVRAVLADMAAHGVVPSFYAVAERACVARSTLYRRSELKRLVAEAREDALRPALRAGGADAPCEVAAEHGELVVLRREVAALRSENAALRRENSSLRSSLTRTTADHEHLEARSATADEPLAVSQVRYDVCPLGEAA